MRALKENHRSNLTNIKKIQTAVTMVEDQQLVKSFQHLKFNTSLTFNSVNAADTNDQDGLASNGKMIAVAMKSTGTVAVFDATKPRTFDANLPLIKGHQGHIQDLQWNPFEDRLLATSADDGKVKLWIFDDNTGCDSTGSRLEPDLELDAHHRKCLSIQWHAAADNLLSTSAVDKTVKIWDINEGRNEEAVITFTDMPDFATSTRWSPDGKMLGVCCKNKSLAVFDPRQEASIVKAGGHEGPRQQRMAWVDDSTLLTTGFDATAKRQWGAWDIRNMEQPLLLGALNDGSAVPYFYYDRQYNIMILQGRGDNVSMVSHFDKSSPTMLNPLYKIGRAHV